MSFVIVHELQGLFSDGVVSCQGRMRCRCNMRLTMDEATRLADNLADLEGIVGVTVNPIIGSVLFFYVDLSSRLEALKIIAIVGDEIVEARKDPQFRAEDLPVPRVEGPLAAVLEIVRHYVLRPFMPWWFSIPSAIGHAIPYLLKGLKELVIGHLNVSVLDAAAMRLAQNGFGSVTRTAQSVRLP